MAGSWWLLAPAGDETLAGSWLLAPGSWERLWMGVVEQNKGGVGGREFLFVTIVIGECVGCHAGLLAELPRYRGSN